MKDDGSQQEKLLSYPDLIMKSVSPDGQWIIAAGPAPGEERPTGGFAYPIKNGSPVRICTYCDAAWSHDQRFFFVRFRAEGSGEGGKAFVIAQAPGGPLPTFRLTVWIMRKICRVYRLCKRSTSTVFPTSRLATIPRSTRFLVSACTATSIKYPFRNNG